MTSENDYPVDMPFHSEVQPIHALQPQRSAHSDFGRNEAGEAGQPLHSITSRPVTDHDRQYFEAQAERAIALKKEAALSAITSREWGEFRRATYAVFTGIVIVGTAACGFIVFSQTVQLLAALGTLPTVLRYSGYAFLAALAGIVLVALARFTIAYFRLRHNEQLSFGQLRALDARQELREFARSSKRKARESLERFVAQYPMDGSSSVSPRLMADQLEKLQEARRKLLDNDRRIDDDNWLKEFAWGFQGELDKAATKAVQEYSTSVGTKTAVSPNPLVDTVIVIHGGFGMLRELCLVYQLRVGPLALIRLAGMVFSHAYLAGRLEDVPVEDWLAQAVNNALSAVGNVNVPILGKLVGSLGGPAIQGVANGMTIVRLGRHAQNLLRPVTET